MRVSFKIKSFDINDRLLFVQCVIEDIKDKEVIQLYIGKTKWSNVKCDKLIVKEGNFLAINLNNCNNIKFSYTVKIGDLSKHGHGGEISKELITFAGEQVFIFPIEALTMADNNSIIDNIRIYFDFKGYKYSIFPLKHNENTLDINCPKWINIYDIMKSSYTFGDFNICQNTYKENSVQVFSEKNFLNKEISLNVIEDLKKLHKYYCDLFNTYGMNLNLIFLNKSIYDENYILGGCGVSNITATFNYESIRDWQLLAHRMFHAFMDYKFKSREMHIPPNLWLTEGLATYYEIISLNILSDIRKRDLNIDSEHEFKKLFARYLYIKLRETKISNIVPMSERNIKSHGCIEFLHYTLAPLIVKLIENKYNKLNTSNCIINEMILLNESKTLSMENIFFNILKENLNEFANKYLFGNEILPLWFLGKYDLEKNKIIEDLNYYEYVLWTWFKLENEHYALYKVQDENLNKIAILSNELGVNFSNEELENKVERFSSIIYNLLKEYALRGKVCSVPYNHINFRNNILLDEEKVALWNNFLQDFIIKS